MLVQPDNFEEVMSSLQGAPLLVCDTETNYCDFQLDRFIMGVAVKNPTGGSYYFPFRHEHTIQYVEGECNLPVGSLKTLIDLFLECTTVWHNKKFDLQQLEDEGYNAKDFKSYDTLTLSHMEDENKFSHKLYDLGRLVGRKKLGTEIDNIAVALSDNPEAKNKAEKHEAKKSGWQRIPPSVMGRYAEEDVEIPWLLFKLFMPRLQEDYDKETLKRLLEDEHDLTHVVRKMENLGLGVNQAKASHLISETQQRLEQVETRLGFEPSKPSQLAHRLYALPENGGLGFQPSGYSSRPSKEFTEGIPIMDSDVLARLNHQVVEDVLLWRKLSKAQSTYYLPFQRKSSRDGRLHADFRQHGTVTTRFACGEPNLQNLPRDMEETPVKSLLEPREGYELWEFDYDQQEFRLAVVYVNSEYYKKAMTSGKDIHSMTAQNIGAYNMFPNNPDQARYCGKQANFLIVNRGGPDVLKQQLWHNARIDLTRSLCKDFLDKWHETTPEFKKFAQQVQRAAEQNGFIKLWNGRKRHFTDGYKCAAAFNSLIQGGAAQIIYHSMRELDKLNYDICAQVHDALWIEIPIDKREECIEEVETIMGWPSKDFEFPFPVSKKLLAA
jgi:DNA polymerase-1